MAQPIVAPIIPNVGALEEAIAGSSEIIFTATDRKIIQERAGEIDRSRRFKEIFKEEGLIPDVENEETTVSEGKNVPELEERLKIHRQMLKHSPPSPPKERVEISPPSVIPDQFVSKPEATTRQPEKPIVFPETAKIIKELNLDPLELTSKFSLDEKELHELILRIKNLHLQRVLSSSKKDFEGLSQRIKKLTLSFAKPQARKWLEEKLNELTLNTARYKLNLLQAMQALEFESNRERDLKWLQEVCESEG